MTNDELKELCFNTYQRIFDSKRKDGIRERDAQRDTIADSLREILLNPETSIEDSATIWKYLHAKHIHRKSGFIDIDKIEAVTSAENSWKKSSGHAFEQMLKTILNPLLIPYKMEIVLQRDLNKLIKDNLISNQPKDLNWLKPQLRSSAFDLYGILINEDNNKKHVFSCIQAKTSIRDRVTRDREPSLQAMQKFFWSVALVLDGDFLRLPKFIHMVNGGSADYPDNGWHGMYVFSNNFNNDRIYFVGENFQIFIEHAISAKNAWKTQRQWLDHNWKADQGQ